MRSKTFALMLIFLIALVGCSDDDNGVTAPPPTGTITISPQPSGINAPWSITGPDEYSNSGTGSSTLSSMTAGSYTLTWGAVSGYTTPSPATQAQTLTAQGSLTFSGTYTAQTGTITISPQPSGINAPWSITGPDEYSNSGTGSSTLSSMTAGSYTLTWGAVAVYTTPSPATVTQTLMASGTLTFAGVYFVDYVNSFVYIAPGTLMPDRFTMGSPSDEPGRDSWEGPQHQVTLTQDFYMSKYQVTEEWWYRVMGGTPTTSQLPKSGVSWDMAVHFCNVLSLQEGLTPAYAIHQPNGDVTWNQSANGYRLPTEAEWEYACRAGTTMTYHNNTNCLSSDTEANFYGSLNQLPNCPTGVARGGRTAVGSFPANQWGLYDMHGNVWEWVWCGLRTYTSSSQVDPVHNVDPGVRRVLRGGYWDSFSKDCRSAYRTASNPFHAYQSLGFRPVRSAP
jgi:formylglycine-generating enzyme required for sulfatase activity